MYECSISFRFQVETSPGQLVKIVGDNSQLGAWNPAKGLALFTTAESYPVWISENPILVPKGIGLRTFQKYKNVKQHKLLAFLFIKK